jgi:hypothetical protein
MGPIQYVFLSIGIMITLVGLARGYEKELGNSIIFMVTVALLGFIENRYEEQIRNFATSVLGMNDPSTFLWLFFSIVFIVVVFMSYSGVTFNFGGKPAVGFWGHFISLIVGMFNGYLVAGTLWYYTDKFGYPLASTAGSLDAQGQAAIQLLPQNIFPDPLYWILPAAVLLILRVRG